MKATLIATAAGMTALLLACDGIRAQPAGTASAPSNAPAGAAQPPRIDMTVVACRPEYPIAAVRKATMGTSKLRFTLDRNGHVVASEIVRPSGPTPEHRLLDLAARDALATCPFRPGVDAGGQPAGGTIDIDYRWILE